MSRTVTFIVIFTLLSAIPTFAETESDKPLKIDATVQHADTGASSWEQADEETSTLWDWSLILGGDFLFANHDNQTSGESRVRTGSLFLDTRTRFVQSFIMWDLRLKLEYGLAKVQGQKTRKAIDDLDIDAAHVWRIHRWINPYIRIRIDSQISAGHTFFSKAVDVRFLGTNKPTKRHTGHLRVSSSFDPTIFGESLGAYFPIIKKEKLKLAFLLGVGGQQFVTDHFYVRRDNKHTPEIEFEWIDDFESWGADGALDLFAMPFEKLSFSSTFECFQSFDGQTRLDWENEMTFQIWQYFFLICSVDMLYDEEIDNEIQWSETVMLRIALRLS